MEKFFLGFLSIIPVFGLYSGLSVAATVPIFFFSCLFYIRRFLDFRIGNNKLEMLLILWIIASSFWSISFVNSFFSAVKFTTEVSLGLLAVQNIRKVNINESKVENILIIALLFSTIAFVIEFLTAGKVSLFFRELMQKKESHIFLLHYLDRGLALLTLLSWVVMSVFLKKENKIAALLVYCTLLVVLRYSDNLAALVAHVIGGFVFIVTRLTILKNPKILCCLFLVCNVLMIIFAFKVDALKAAQENDILPISAKHRLFIWNFIADNSLNHPILGIGFNGSRQFPVREDQLIKLFGHTLSPLPLHPHNNVMQVYFELGLIGLIFYLSLACKYILIVGKDYKTTNLISKDLICSLYGCFAVYWIMAMISYSLWQSWWVFSILWISSLCSMLIIPKIHS